MTKILIIDDDPIAREILVEYIKPFGYTVMVKETLKEGIQLAAIGKFDLVLLDINLPDGNGLDALPEIRKSASEPEVIIITAEGCAAGAAMAFENGAWDYILKPFSPQEFKLTIKRVLEYRESKQTLKTSSEFIFDRSDVIGSSPKMTISLHAAAQCAQSDANTLITGQTGTGKELIANTIHKNSNRKKGHFVVVDCAALPEQLVEAVLFGNVKGAFTGADSSREGLVKKADGGTLFLDEVGELPLSIQKKFLRVLQERKFKSVGGTQDIQSNFRLISATNRTLEEMVSEGQFRSDLLFRLKTIHIELPPLKECKADIKDLALHYIHSICERDGFETKGFSSDFLRMLELYDWPGNIREFINCLEKTILTNPESTMLYPNFLPNQIRLMDLQPRIEEQLQANNPGGDLFNQVEPFRPIELPTAFLKPIKPLKQVKEYILSQFEKIYLDELMAASNNDLDTAGSLAGISKSYLYSLLKKYQTSHK